jgi:peptidyl-prolyl cis-trans isomerase D
MLNILRKKENMRAILWIICVIIIVTFVFFGVRTPFFGQGSQSGYAGTVYGKKISTEDFAKSYKACYNQALMLYGNNLPKVKDRLNLEAQAWERIILLRQAEEQGINANDEEIRSRIIEIFGGSEKFDKEIYESALVNYFNTSARAFEEQIRNTLKISKLINEITSDITISDDEVLEMYRKENEKIKVEYILIKPESFIDKIKPTDSDLINFYKENKQAFKTQPKINIEYIAVATDDFIDAVEVSEEEIENYYENNKASFITDADTDEVTSHKSLNEVKNEIKTILLKQAAKDLAMDKAIVIEQQLDAGDNLAEAANNNDVVLKETGFFAATESIPDIGWNFQFLQTAYNLKEDEISKITEMPNGYYILRLKGRQASYIPDFEEVKEKVKKAYTANKAFEMANTQAITAKQDIEEYISDGMSFKAAAKNIELEAQSTDFFVYKDYVESVGRSPEFNEAAFNLNINQVSEVIETSKGYIILSPEDKIAIDKEKFKKNKEEFEKKALQIKQAQVLQEWFESILQEANLKSNI